MEFEATNAALSAQIANEKILTAEANEAIAKGTAQRQAVLLESREREVTRSAQNATDAQQLAEELLSVSTEDVDEAVDRVIERLRALGEREVPTTRIGDFVMRELAKLDKIAYIRFASVYRSFETPDDFREAVQEVKAGRKSRRK
mgnify:CR=1 FL=1